MKSGLILAWLTGLGIITWRDIRVSHGPPIPGQLLGASGLFALLAIIAEYEPARTTATLAAWGFDIAALLNILPAGIGGKPRPGSTAAPAGGGGAIPSVKSPGQP